MTKEILLNNYGDVLGQKLSGYLAPTLKEDPSDAEVISHKLMLRGGYIRRNAAGIYSYLPLALRSLRKVERIIRREMNKAGALEIFMPTVQPAELWQESGRWDGYGKELLRFKDRHERNFVLGPTHEEVVTEIAKNNISSWRDLPLNLYQIQTKFRDEIRPRFGLMRGREFIMKDAYSFDIDDENADIAYRKMYEAYTAIFEKCGLKFAAVEADTGSIGGDFSHEFMVLAETGEDDLAFCQNCNYAANTEKAVVSHYTTVVANTEKKLEKVKTPNCKTVEEVANFLKVELSAIIKALIFKSEDKYFMALIPGHREINQIKLKNALKLSAELVLAEKEEVLKLLGSEIGFIGPVNANNITIVADNGVKEMVSGVVGGGETDTHYINAKIERDFKVNFYTDIALITEGDNCPKCSEKITIKKGIEVGHVFKLGTKYSKPLGAVYCDKNGEDKPMVMGCFGIGVSRILAAAIEQGHDKDGIIWPLALAPFEVVVLPLQTQKEEVLKASEKIYNSLLALGIETVLDDRNERPGFKFKDADLIGYPFKIAVSEKSLALGQVEFKIRKTQKMQMVSIDEIANVVLELKNEVFNSYTGKNNITSGGNTI